MTNSLLPIWKVSQKIFLTPKVSSNALTGQNTDVWCVLIFSGQEQFQLLAEDMEAS